MNIYNLIKKKRLACGLNQYDFAKKTKKLNQSQVSKIERGERKITTEDLSCMAEALNISVDELLKDSQ